MLIEFFVFKQKTAYEMRISDCSSDVCSSDLTTSTAPSVAIGIARITDGSSATKARIQTPCRIVDRRDTAPAWTFAELRTMTPVIGNAPTPPHSMLPTPCARSSLLKSLRGPSCILSTAAADSNVSALAMKATAMAAAMISGVRQPAKAEVGRASCREREGQD